jgi:hypothetical protein
MNISCNVSDYNTGSAINGYNVLFYSPEGYLGNARTGINGKAIIEVDLSDYPSGSHEFACEIYDNYWYQGVVKTASEYLSIIDSINVTITSPLEEQIVYRYSEILLNSTIRDDDGIILSVDNFSWTIENSEIISESPEDYWNVNNYELGPKNIHAKASKENYYNGTDEISIQIWTWVQLNDSIISSPAYTEEYITYSCTAIEYNSSERISEVNISFSTDSGLLGHNLSDDSGIASYTFRYDEEIIENISCSIVSGNFRTAINKTMIIDLLNVTERIDMPRPQIIIDYGNATYTNDNFVNLYISGQQFNRMQFSCNQSSWTGWIDYDEETIIIDFDLSNESLGCNNSYGIKTIYMNATNSNNLSLIASDDIIFDITAISESFFIDYFTDNDSLLMHTNMTFNSSLNGGLRFSAGCIDYPLEEGCWMHRLNLNISETNGESYSDMEINITLDTEELISRSKLRTDCLDIRAVWYNISSESFQEIPYWFDNDSCGLSDLELWTKLPYIGSYERINIYIYYGNSEATLNEYLNGSKVFSFFDDFKGNSLDTSIWFHNEGSYSIANSEFIGDQGDSIEYIGSYHQVSSSSRIMFKMRTNLEAPNDWDSGVAIGVNQLRFVDDRDNQQVMTIDPGTWWGSDYVQGTQNRANKTRHHIYGITMDGSSSVFKDYTQGRQNSYAGVASGSVYIINDAENALGGQTIIDWIYSVNRVNIPLTISITEESNYQRSGTVKSSLIRPTAKQSWLYLELEHEIPESASLFYYIKDIDNNTICSFEGIEPITVYDISGCGYDSHDIYVEAIMNTSDGFSSPFIDMWKISWLQKTSIKMKDPTQIYLNRFSSYRFNGSLSPDYDECTVSVKLQYKMTSQLNSFVDSDRSDFAKGSSDIQVSILDDLKIKSDLPTGNLIDQGWKERFQILLSMDESKVNYPVMLKISSNDIDFQRTDFEDIRFSYLNSTKEENISHWVQQKNDTEVVLWIKMPEISSEEISVFMYYDNVLAVDISNGDDVFLFFDDFEGTTLDTSKWTELLSSYKIQNSEFEGFTGNDRIFIESKIDISNESMISFRMKASGSSSDWDGGIGVGSAMPNINFIDDTSASRTYLAIDYERWWAPSGYITNPTGSDDPTEFSIYEVRMNGTHSNFTEGRRTTLDSNVAHGPLYIVNDGESTGENTIIDWIYVRPYGNDPQIIKIGKNISYMPEGNYSSQIFDSGSEQVDYGLISWEEVLDSGCLIKIFTRTSEDGIYWNSWEEQFNNYKITSEEKRYIQYKASLFSSNLNNTPELLGLTIFYSNSADEYSEVTPSDFVFSAYTPWNCGTLNKTDACYPDLNVEPKERGMFNLRFFGNSSDCIYSDVSNEKVIYVFANTEITGLQSSPNPVAENETVVISGFLKDDLGQAISGKTINIYDDYNHLGYAKTSTDGYFSYSYPITKEISTGIHTLSGVFDRDYYYYYSAASASTQLRVTSIPIINEILVTPESYGNGDPLNITVNVTDQVGIKIVNITIRNPLGDISSDLATEGPDGLYKTNYSNTWSAGSYIITVKAVNLDDKEKEESSSFFIEIEASVSSLADQESYMNYKDVLLSEIYPNGRAKRLPIIIETVSPVKNYTLVLNLNETNFNDWNLTDGSDLYISYLEKGKESKAEHWVKFWDITGKEAVIYALIPELSTSSTIYMYYNKSEVYDYGNKTKAMLWFDNASYDKYSEYTFIELYNRGAGSFLTWDSANNWIRIDRSNDDFVAYPTGVITDKFYAEVTVRGNDNDGFGLFVKSGSTYYQAFISSDHPSSGADGIFTQTVGATTPTLFSQTENNYNSQFETHTIGLSYDGTNLTMYVDGNREVSREISLTPDAIGLVSIAQSSVAGDFFYNFSIRAIASDVSYEFKIEEKPNGIFNYGSNSIKGYRWAIIQKKQDSEWIDIWPARINDMSGNNLKIISPKEVLEFEEDWNNNPWSTSIHPRGDYRIKFAFVGTKGNPQDDSSIITDSDGNPLVSYYEFRIRESELIVTNLSYPNKIDYGLNEYETTDIISWINISIMAKNNTAFDVNVSLTLLDELEISYIGFGPYNEKKGYGEISINQTVERQWNNDTSGYYIPYDIVAGTYLLKWDISLALLNGISYSNVSEILIVHDIPSNIEVSGINRIYLEGLISPEVLFKNPWSREINNVSIKINCPDLEGLSCSCVLDGQEGDLCIYNEINQNESFRFEITTNASTPMGDYRVNFTVNYTNPLEEKKSWTDIKNAVVEIRPANLFEIIAYDIPNTLVRGKESQFKAYAKSTNITQPVTEAYLNLTLYPADWTISIGSNYSYEPLIEVGQILWNNITFEIPTSSPLGIVEIMYNSTTEELMPDFKRIEISVFGETNISFESSDYNASINETIVLSAELRWDNGFALQNKRVYFYDMTEGLFIGSALTDTGGTAKVDYTLEESLSLGDHIINVSYSGDENLFALNSSSNITINIGTKPEIKDISLSDSVIGYGYNLRITANITDDGYISEALINITDPKGDIHSVPMINISSTLFEAYFNGSWINGSYQFFIYALDNSKSFLISQEYSYNVTIDADLVLRTDKDSYSQNSFVELQDTGLWWDPRWHKRKIFNITGTQEEEDYKMRLSLNSTNTNFSILDNSGNNLRFTYYNLSSGTEIEISYWIESFSKAESKATVWIRLPILSEETIIYMYYNTSIEEEASNASKVFDFFDDFLGSGLSDKWEHISGGYTITTSEFIGTAGDSISYVRTKSFNVSNTTVIVFQMRTDAILDWDGGLGIGEGSGNMNFVDDTSASGTYLTIDYERWWGPDYVSGTIRNNPTEHHIYRIIMNGSESKFIDDTGGRINSYPAVAKGPVLIVNDGENNGAKTIIDWIGIYNYSTASSQYKGSSDEESLGSVIFTRSPSYFYGHLIMVIEKEDTGSWSYLETIVNDSSDNYLRYFPLKSSLNLASIWNPWNTTIEEEGVYRVYSYVINPSGEKLNDEAGEIEGSYEFSILPSDINITIDAIRIYEINESTFYSGGILLDTGLNKTFNIFVNKTYRFEIQTKNNPNSLIWDSSKANVSYLGLNELWRIEQAWHKIESEDINFSGIINSEKILWNISKIIESSSSVIYSFIINLSEEEIIEDRNVLFSIKDPLFKRSDSSIISINPLVDGPPRIFEDIYNLSSDELIRSINTSVIFARWDQKIQEARIDYNTITPSIISSEIELSDPNSYNWTNFTLSPSSNWFLGKHSARIRAKNPSGIWNDSLDYLNYSVYGLSYIKEISLNTTTINLGDSVRIYCTVYDNTNNSPLNDYNVSFLSGNQIISENKTNHSGQIYYDYIPDNYGIYELGCNISGNDLYKIDSRSINKTELFIREFEPPSFDEIISPAIAHKTDNISLKVFWSDNAGLLESVLVSDETGSFENISTVNLSGKESWANFSYVLPLNLTPGILRWYQIGVDTSRNTNKSPAYNITVWGYSSINNSNLYPENVKIGNYTTISCQVIDSNSTVKITSYNVSFYREGILIGTNITLEDGWASFRFNDSGIGLHSLKCNITNNPELYYNMTSINEETAILNVVDSDDVKSPGLIMYGINETSVNRGECIKIFGQWDEEINSSRVYFNKTVEFSFEEIPPPYSDNWTNSTICTGFDWNAGIHDIKLWANDSSGNINNSVPYKQFTMYGISSLRWHGPFGNVTKGYVELMCNVSDINNSNPIYGYPVEFYGPKGYIDSEITNEEGIAIANTDLSSYDSGINEFFCVISDNLPLYYKRNHSISYGYIILEDTFDIILDSPEDNIILNNSEIDFNWTVESTSESDIFCNLTINNKVNESSIPVSTGIGAGKKVSAFSNGIYKWNLSCWNDNQINFSETRLFSVILNENTPPETPDLITPENNNLSVFERRPFFSWNQSYDAEGDSLDYDIYIELELCSEPLGCDILEINQTGISSLNYTPLIDLDTDSRYSWMVRAFDGLNYSNWSERWNFTIESQIILTLVNDNVSFGVQTRGEIINTTDNNPQPFILRNDGNVPINIINISAQDELWEQPSAAMPSRYFQYKVDEREAEPDSFNKTESRMNWTEIGNYTSAIVIYQISHQDGHDEAEVDILIEVPWDEPPGAKTTSLNFIGEIS